MSNQELVAMIGFASLGGALLGPWGAVALPAAFAVGRWWLP